MSQLAHKYSTTNPSPGGQPGECLSFGYCQTLNSVLGTVEFSLAQLVGNLGNVSACPQVVHYLPLTRWATWGMYQLAHKYSTTNPSLGGQPGEYLSLPTSSPLLALHLVGNLGNISACPQVVHYLPRTWWATWGSLPTSIPLLAPHLVGNLGNVSACPQVVHYNPFTWWATWGMSQLAHKYSTTNPSPGGQPGECLSFGYCQTLNSVLGTVEFSLAQ